MGVDPEDIIPSKYYTMAALSYSLIQKKLLMVLDKDLYNQNNTRWYLRESAGDSKREFATHRLVYETGIPLDFKLHGEHRVWSYAGTTAVASASSRSLTRLMVRIRCRVGLCACA